MKLYRATGGSKKDEKNIGTYYTSSIDEARFYGSSITEHDIDTANLMIVDENGLNQYIEKWLDSLADEDRDFEESTQRYFYNQQDEILAADDAKKHGYDGIIIKNITGESGCVCDYVIIF
jgi:hypothetical protein